MFCFYLESTYADRAMCMFQLKIPPDENYCMFKQCPRNQNIYRYMYNILINANVLLISLFRREHVFCFKTMLLIIVKKIKNDTHAL